MGFALTPGEAPLHFSRSKNVMHVAHFIVYVYDLYNRKHTQQNHTMKRRHVGRGMDS